MVLRPVFSSCLFLTLCWLCGSLNLVNAGSLVNVTVDDVFGNSAENIIIRYQPDNTWEIGNQCSTCSAHLDTTRVFDGTWHDCSYLPGTPFSGTQVASLSFDGVAIYVYGVTTGSYSHPPGNFNMTFFIDGDRVGTFVLAPTGNPTYRYDQLFYANTSLSSGKHTLDLVNANSGTEQVLVLLDYMVFTRDIPDSTEEGTPATTPTPTPTTHKSNHTAVVAGAAVGGLLGAVAVLLIIYWLVRWWQRRTQSGNWDEKRSVPGEPPSLGLTSEQGLDASHYPSSGWPTGNGLSSSSGLGTQPSQSLPLSTSVLTASAVSPLSPNRRAHTTASTAALVPRDTSGLLGGSTYAPRPSLSVTAYRTTNATDTGPPSARSLQNVPRAGPDLGVGVVSVTAVAAEEDRSEIPILPSDSESVPARAGQKNLGYALVEGGIVPSDAEGRNGAESRLDRLTTWTSEEAFTPESDGPPPYSRHAE